MFVQRVGPIVANGAALRPVNGKCIRIGEQLWAVRTDWGSGARRVVLVDGRMVVRRGLVVMLRLGLRGQRLARTVGGIGVDHKVKTLLGGRQFGDVVLWVCSADMFLH